MAVTAHVRRVSCRSPASPSAVRIQLSAASNSVRLGQSSAIYMSRTSPTNSFIYIRRQARRVTAGDHSVHCEMMLAGCRRALELCYVRVLCAVRALLLRCIRGSPIGASLAAAKQAQPSNPDAKHPQTQSANARSLAALTPKPQHNFWSR